MSVQIRPGQILLSNVSEVKKMYEDKTLTCKECGAEFVFTAGEQEFYASRGFVNEPQRCKACRDARKNASRPERVICKDDRGAAYVSIGFEYVQIKCTTGMLWIFPGHPFLFLGDRDVAILWVPYYNKHKCLGQSCV